MPDVLIRGVPSGDLEEIRSAATQEGMSLQAYLLGALRAQAAHLRRSDALLRSADRLAGRPPVPEGERQGVLESIEAAHRERGQRLVDRVER